MTQIKVNAKWLKEKAEESQAKVRKLSSIKTENPVELNEVLLQATRELGKIDIIHEIFQKENMKINIIANN